MQLELHIKNEGTPRDCHRCAVAMAFLRAGATEATVFSTEAMLTWQGQTMHCSWLPEEIQDVIWEFDQGIPFEPFTVVIEAEPWESLSGLVLAV